MPTSPTYSRSGSYLDICIADNRIFFDIDRTSPLLRTLTYYSDHRALLFEVNTELDNDIILNTQNINGRRDFKRTNWRNPK